MPCFAQSLAVITGTDFFFLVFVKRDDWVGGVFCGNTTAMCLG